MKAQAPWYEISLERENYQLSQYVDYNLFPLYIYECQLHNMLILNSPTWLCFSRLWNNLRQIRSKWKYNEKLGNLKICEQ
jgi:hypothetical protein